ncbi:MAG: proP [Rhodospirillales bacterium]|nr:proP [Rhodospirillales bacterium]
MAQRASPERVNAPRGLHRAGRRMSPQIRIFLVFALGYFVSYVFRGVNLVLAPLLSRDLGIDATALGGLTSAYLVGFAGFQIPLGLLLDRYGPRRVEAVLLVGAAAGSAIFAIGDNVTTLIIGRGLIGIGVSVCLVGAVKALSLWFPLEKLSFLNGAIFALGGLGGAATGTPVELLMHVLGWRALFLCLAGLTLAVALLVLLVAPEHPGNPGKSSSLAEQWHGLAGIMRSRIFWSIALLPSVGTGVFLAVQGLWAGPFMRDVEGLDAADTAANVVISALAMVAGGFALGWVARQLDRRGVSTYLTASAALVVFLAVQTEIIAGAPLPAALQWTLYGFFGSATMLVYAVLQGLFPVAMTGRLGAASTLLAFVLAFVFQIGFGAIVDLWPRDAAGHAPAAAHLAAWTVGLAAQLAAAIPFALSWREVQRRSRG